MGDWTAPDRRFSKIGQRLLTALVLIPIGLWVVWSGGWALAVACAVFAAAMAWEWGGMSGHPRAVWLCAAAAAFCLVLPLQTGWLQAFAGMAGLAFAFAATPGGVNLKVRTALGLIYVTAMAAALWLLREGPWDGLAAALYFMSFVWASDAAAYFTGRGLGGPRLLPHESPNKTWSGALGAVFVTCACGYAAADLEQVASLNWVIAAVLVSVTAQAGDLLESGLKRRFKVKDSSGLLPGHGGVLDRVDGLGAVAVVAVLVLWFFPAVRAALGLTA